MHTTDLHQQLTEQIKNFADKEEFYIAQKYTFADILLYAAGFKKSFDTHKGSICICTEDQGIIMAAIIAVLCSQTKLVFPYAFSKQVLAETKETTNFTGIITDSDLTGLPGIKKIELSTGDTRKLQLQKKTDDVCLTLFTGGSTGRPKIWTKTVGNIFNEAFYLKSKFSIGNKDTVIATVPPYHIYGLLFSVIVPFISTATVLPGIYVFPQEIAGKIQEQNATLLISVPMHYRTLRTTIIENNSLRLAFSSAGALDPKDGDNFYTNNQTPLYEIYGSTETGGIASRCRAYQEQGLTVFDNIDWKINEERLLVKSEFISPELPRDPEGYFTTGDRVEKKDNRSFMLLGRADGIVKVAGKRVDLQYIQNKIKSLPQVNDAYILSLPVERGRENEIAALVETTLDEQSIRIQAQELLESYAVPKKIKVIDRIPLSKTGKYNKKTIEELFTR